MIIQNINNVSANKTCNSYRESSFKPAMSSLNHDTFEFSKKISFMGNFQNELDEDTKERIKSFKVNSHACSDREEYVKLGQITKDKHIKRNEIYGTNKKAPEMVLVSPQKYQAIYDVQYEAGEYLDMNKKMRKNEPLNKAEQKFYDRIVSQMDTLDEPKTLWRMIMPYDGFEDEIKSGTYKFKGLTSTSSVYDDFFDFWTGDKIDHKNKKFEEGYILKINVPKGTKVLNCNAYTKRPFKKPQYPKMRGEVVLPEYNARVINVDNDLNVIEMEIIP